jgi:hypothetical protein
VGLCRKPQTQSRGLRTPLTIYLDFVEENGNDDILDERRLPATKDSLENAFRLVIATEPSADVRRTLHSAGVTLASFQAGVTVPISLAPARKGGLSETALDGSSSTIGLVLNKVAADLVRMRRFFAAADEIASRQYGRRFSRPFNDDGTYNWHGHY